MKTFKYKNSTDDGTRNAVKAARSVWRRGKVGDYFRDLPIPIWSPVWWVWNRFCLVQKVSRFPCSGRWHPSLDGWRASARRAPRAGLPLRQVRCWLQFVFSMFDVVAWATMFSRSSDTMFSFLAQCSSCLIFFSPILFSGDENKIGDFAGKGVAVRFAFAAINVPCSGSWYDDSGPFPKSQGPGPKFSAVRQKWLKESSPRFMCAAFYRQLADYSTVSWRDDEFPNKAYRQRAGVRRIGRRSRVQTAVPVRHWCF